MAHEILLRTYMHGHDMANGRKKTQNMNIWLLGRTLLGVAFFGFSNSVSKVKRYVQCCAVGTDSRYLISERVAHSAQPSQAKPQHYFQWRISFHGFII